MPNQTNKTFASQAYTAGLCRLPECTDATLMVPVRVKDWQTLIKQTRKKSQVQDTLLADLSLS